MKKNYGSKMLAAVHETAEGLHRVGAMSDAEMREFDEMCLEPEPEPASPDVASLRLRSGLSERDFAAELGVSLSRLKAYEAGQRKPTGSTLRLLRLYERRPSLMKLKLSAPPRNLAKRSRVRAGQAA